MAKKHDNLFEFFRNSPLVDSGIDLNREPDVIHNPVELELGSLKQMDVDQQLREKQLASLK